MKRSTIRVLVVDDHDMLREGLATFLRAFRDLQLVGEAANGAEAVQLSEELKPDVVLMDLLMPEMDGVTAIGLIHQKQPQVRIIALSSFAEDKLVKSALTAGATSYLLKNVSADRLADAIRATSSGLPTLAPEIAPALVQPAAAVPDGYDLTPREFEVLTLMVRGMSNLQMSQLLAISAYTVKNHVSNILSKLGVKSRTQAVSLALRRRLVHTD